MTQNFPVDSLAETISQQFPQAVVQAADTCVYLQPDDLRKVASFLKETPGLEFSYLVSVTGVDYVDYFELVYHLVSISHNHSAVIKVKVCGREDPIVPSVVPVWKGADLQEREVYDLMGIHFEGHPNLKRILLWDEFPGHPLRKDFWYQNPSIGSRWYETTQKDASQD
ncbi:MAG: NADH-quinone oxidoreductase subunit C [Dehalococcoidia bacterium]|nr:NADH-quinone oxidoreductase subunit C [Dehalococcoidia bacterium]